MNCTGIVDIAFLEALRNFNIFQKRTGLRPGGEFGPYADRLAVGDKIHFDRSTLIEEYSTFAAGDVLFSSGAFSSLSSSLRLGSVVGRYTSLAPAFKNFGFRHPIEAVCMNSAVFNFKRENVHPYFSKYEKHNELILIKQPVPVPQPQNSAISVGNDVWIGSDVSISGGIEIGDGAVIASGSVVTKNVDPYTIVAGVPARPRKKDFLQK